MKKILFLSIVSVILIFFNCVRRVNLKENLPEYSDLQAYSRELRTRNYQNAIAGYELFIKKYPDSPLLEDAYYELGYANLKIEKFTQAERYFMEVLKRFPGGDYARKSTLGLAITAIQKGNYTEAKQMLEPLLKSQTVESAQIEYLLGEVNYYLKNNFQALIYFRESALHFVSPGLKENARTVIEEMLIPSLTVDELKRCVDYFPKDFPGAECLIKLAEDSINNGNAQEAGHYSETLLYYFPGDRNAARAEEILDIIEKQKRINLTSVGLVLPVSGEYGGYGLKILKGCLHSAGIFSEVEKKKYTIIVADTNQSNVVTERWVNELVSKYNVAAIAGPLFPSTSYSAATRAQILGVPILLLTNADRLNDIGEYVFSFGLTDASEARTIARYAVTDLNLKKFAILYPDSSSGNSEMNAFWDEIEKYGGKVVGIESYKPDKKEFSAEIKKLVGLYYLDTREDEKKEWIESNKGRDKKAKQWKPYPIIDFEAIFIPDRYDAVSIILLYLPYYDILTPIPLGTSGWNNQGLLSQAKKEAEGSIFPDIFSEKSESPEVRYFVETYRLSFNESPDRYSAMGYDACNLIIKSIEEGARTREEIRRSLLKINNYTGVTGILNFNKDREIERNFVIFQVKNGKIEVIKDGANP
jgi:ABC-type branched-subunit amino acid transport system substrate-binding protein/outer membrane protein assembly factor BamD (BamD/ComL family)